jgi:hypothetical protein
MQDVSPKGIMINKQWTKVDANVKCHLDPDIDIEACKHTFERNILLSGVHCSPKKRRMERGAWSV